VLCVSCNGPEVFTTGNTESTEGVLLQQLSHFQNWYIRSHSSRVITPSSGSGDPAHLPDQATAILKNVVTDNLSVIYITEAASPYDSQYGHGGLSMLNPAEDCFRTRSLASLDHIPYAGFVPGAPPNELVPKRFYTSTVPEVISKAPCPALWVAASGRIP